MLNIFTIFEHAIESMSVRFSPDTDLHINVNMMHPTRRIYQAVNLDKINKRGRGTPASLV